MTKIQALTAIYEDTFRTEFTISNEENLKLFKKFERDFLNKEKLIIEKLINRYNALVFALRDTKGIAKNLLLEEIESVDIELDFRIEHIFNSHCKALTSIVNAA